MKKKTHLDLCKLQNVGNTHPRPLVDTQSHRSLGVHQQKVFGQSVVHARQYVGPRVGRARTDQEVAVVLQQFFGVPAAHFAVEPGLALQLLLGPEGQRAHEQRAGVVHRRHLVETRGLGLTVGRWVGLGLNGVPEGLWCE